MSQRKPPATIKGVSALLGEDDEISSSQELAIQSIQFASAQPRKYFDPTKLAKLVSSIQKKGILEPLLVRPLPNGRYELVAGERRLRAAMEAGLSTVPAVVKELSDNEAFEIALIENLQREDLNPVEETEGVLYLLSLKLDSSVAEVKSMFNRLLNEDLGKVTSNVTGNSLKPEIEAILEPIGINWKSFATNKIPLLNLPENVLVALRNGKLEYTKAKAIARVKDEGKREELLDKAIAEKLSLAQIQELASSFKAVEGKAADPQAELKFRVTSTLRRASKVKDLDPKKQQKLLKYLAEIEALLD